MIDVVGAAKRIAAITTTLEAAAPPLAQPSIALTMRLFGLVVPGVGTFHYPANAWGAAAVLQTAVTYAHAHPAAFLVAPATSACLFYTKCGGWLPGCPLDKWSRGSFRLKSKL